MNYKKLREAAEAASDTTRATLMRYEHGGGRLFFDGETGERQLIADFYDEANREYYYEASPQAILQLLRDLNQAVYERDNAKAARDRAYREIDGPEVLK